MLPIVVEQGNSPVIQTTVRDTLTGNYYNGTATVLLTVLDEAGQPVSGQVWPAALVYVGGSQGVYRTQLEDDVGMIAGQKYTAKFLITVGSVTRELDQEVFVTKPTGDVLPASNPASPAYQGPNLQTLLNQAELAYHTLMMGGKPTVVVDQNGERVEFSSQSPLRLAAYIQSLKIQLGLITGKPLKAYFS